MIAAAMEHKGVTALYSYDHDFDKLPGVARPEP
jgi:predicted nucleic acid-binding protein